VKPFDWTGDLDDDCTCVVTLAGVEYTLRAEAMGKVIVVEGDNNEDPDCWRSEYWWAAVVRGRDEIWSTNDFCGMILGGVRAREFAEKAVLAHVGEMALAGGWS
jgi:hypothetical protein